jgi:wyosine [tRNA(Phe)-imidazoG37] synthetase (radical SAM superfamily)
MSTFLFDDIVFGPVKSRRLGLSLGINLLPVDSKFCNFNCIYCECGWNTESIGKIKYPTREEVRNRLIQKLDEMKLKGEEPDVITFAGNGEPTLHPSFDRIIDDTITIRDEKCPETKIAVLSNATMVHSIKVFEALQKVDENILKLDSAFEKTIAIHNNPYQGFSLGKVLEIMKLFKGKLIIQTLFLRGSYNGKVIDNTTEEEITAWLELLTVVNPKKVMVYTIARDTPARDLIKIPLSELKIIAQRVKKLGIDVQISG